MLDSAKGHDYTGAPATCTTPQVCARSGCEAVLEEAPGHTEVIDAAVAPTCTATGLTEGRYCSVCDEVLVKQEVVPKATHAYGASVTDPTCTKGGYTTYTCALCKDSYAADETAPRGHYFGAWASDGEDAHSALCRRNGCGHTGTVACQWLDYRLEAADAQEPVAFALCPVCGEVSDGARLLAVENVEAEALTEALPAGEVILRMGELTGGEALMSVGFEYGGKLTQPTGEVKITLPAELLKGCALTLLDADGTQSQLAFTVEEGEASFTLDFAPAEEEAPVPARAILLAPLAA